MSNKTAKDTVMHPYEMENLLKDTPPNLNADFKRIAEAQAEISFSLGEKQGYEKGIKEVDNAYKKGWDNAKKYNSRQAT